jgi:Bacterial TSP3 repeat
MNDRQQGQSFRKLPRPQKVAVISLSLVAVGILFVWFWQFNTRINSPFRASDAEIAQAKKTAEQKAATELANKNKDTDKDGLTDIEETTIYKTSPYLEDTDGDGISDFEEVRLGKDPLCPEGSTCGLINSQTALSTSTASSSLSSLTPAENVDQTLIIKALSGQGDAATMRQILIQGGANPEQIKLLSDDDLMTIYADVLKAQNPGAVISTSSATSTNQ